MIEIGRWREKKLAAAISVICVRDFGSFSGGRDTYEMGQYGVY